MSYNLWEIFEQIVNRNIDRKFRVYNNYDIQYFFTKVNIVQKVPINF